MSIGLPPLIQVTTHQLMRFRYGLFAPLALLEGTTVAFLAGVLVGIGTFDPLIAYPILIIGDVIPDSLWYWAGRHAHKRDLINRFGPRIGITDQRLEFLLKLWRKHPSKTVALSKLAYGMGAPMLMSAGYARLSWKRYYGTAIPVSIIQYGFLMYLGAAANRSYHAMLPYVQNAGLLFAGFVIIILVVAALSSRAARSALLSETSEQNRA